MITVVIGKIIHGSLYLGGPTIQEVDGKMMMGLSIYGVAVINGSLYSRFYGISKYHNLCYLVLKSSSFNWILQIFE